MTEHFRRIFSEPVMLNLLKDGSIEITIVDDKSIPPIVLSTDLIKTHKLYLCDFNDIGRKL